MKKWEHVNTIKSHWSLCLAYLSYMSWIDQVVPYVVMDTFWTLNLLKLKLLYIFYYTKALFLKDYFTDEVWAFFLVFLPSR